MAKNKKSWDDSPSKKNLTQKPKPSQPSIALYPNAPMLYGLAAMLITFICFITAIDNNFVNWDDDRNFYENPLIQNISNANFWATTKEIFTSGVIGNYNPLTIWTFGLEKIWFGFEKPHLWHLNNIILHVICVFLVYRIAVLLRVGWKGALLTALLFGIHPMRVESVAWVTERKDVLFGVFYLAAIWQYIKWKYDQKSIRWIWLSIFFILSLFSKIQAVSLPLSLVAIDYFMDKSITLKNITQKIPLFLMSLLFGVLGIIMLRDFGSLATVEDSTNFNFIQRLFVGAFSFVIYLVKLIIPFRMSPLYPYPNHFPTYFYPFILIAPLVIYYLWKWYNEGKTTLVFGLTFFIVNIVFLLQILGAGQGYLADRFTYIAYFGMFFIAGYYFDKWLTEKPQQQTVLYSVSGIVLVAFAYMTIQQNKIWNTSASLWSHVIKYYDQTTLPYGNRANHYRELKMYKEALADYTKTLSLKEAQPQAYNSRGRLFFDIAKTVDTLEMAKADYMKAISFEPENGEFHVNLGATYARLGNVDKAIEEFNLGLKYKPDHAVGYLNRSIMYNSLGKTDLALKDIESYLNLNPYNPDLWYEKARALRVLNRPQEAITAYTKALELKSNNKGMYHYERAKTYAQLNQINEAKADLSQAIQFGFDKIDPSFKQQLGM